MRALLQVSMLVSSETELKAWLNSKGYNPEDIRIPESIRDQLRTLPTPKSGDSLPRNFFEEDYIHKTDKDKPENPNETRICVNGTYKTSTTDEPGTSKGDSASGSAEIARSKMELSDQKICYIISTIPNDEDERTVAILNMKYYIHYYDNKHGHSVEGLVCIKGSHVWIRWRNKYSRSLERAMERLVDDVRGSSRNGISNKKYNSGTPKELFEPFDHGSHIQVREASNASDSYVGIIKQDDGQINEKARRDKKLERLTAQAALMATIICFLSSYYFDVYLPTHSNLCAAIDWVTWFSSIFSASHDPCVTADPVNIDRLKWYGGLFDRFGTATSVTCLISFANYRYYRSELLRKPTITWE